MMLLEGTYASYKLTPQSADKLMNWITDSGITSPSPKEELHVTTTFSRADVDLVPSDKKNIVLNPSGYSIGVLKNALVLHIESDELTKVHDAALDAGATTDYPSYKPHITLSYDAEANEELIHNLVPPTFEITLSHEEVKPLREAFDIWLGYDFWGWVDPNGELILPTKKMQASNMIYTHIRLLPKIRTYGKAFSLNYIRFHIRRNKLTFDLSATTPKDIAQKGYRNIEKFLKTNKKYLKDVFGKDDVNFIHFKYELNKPPAKGSPYPDEWDVVDEGDSYRELLRKLPFAGKTDSMKEDTPANVSGNIAVVDKPLFKPIRRKVTNDIYRKIKSSKKSWKDIVEEYNIDYDNRSPLIVENENGDWMFLKYGTLIY